MRARLTIEKGEGSPNVHELLPGQANTLGRSRKNTIVLQDEHASREHAQIVCDNGQWYIEDLNTLNGTFVDGDKITARQQLDNGQIIGIADMRLRFGLEDADLPPAQDKAGGETAGGTLFLTDELTALYQYMQACEGETDPQGVIQRTLETVTRHTQARLAGFLNLDPDHPVSKMIVPREVDMDKDLSRSLTQKARESGRTVWLQGGGTPPSAMDSLASYSDALCIPLLAEDGPLGAVHVYKERRPFAGREVQFCEVVAGFAAFNLARLRRYRILAAENSRLKGRAAMVDELIGASPALQALREKIVRAAASNATVLVEGESGVGKELVANALHLGSPRRHGPFVVAHCGALTDSLIESQLFGHRKGAFTGAAADHAGYFQQADDGTLFLDEIGDMPLEGQVRLLRVIEGQPFRPVGGATDIRSDVRIVAATNKDLEEAVKAKTFRQDLFFRLRVVYLRVPPLREHAEDVPAIVEHFLRQFTPAGAAAKTISPAALRRLQDYSWPGNVRQLRSVLENALVMGEGPSIEPRDLGFVEVPAAVDHPPSFNLEEVEAWVIRKVLDQADNNTLAAQMLGIGRDTLRKKIDQYNLGKGAD